MKKVVGDKKNSGPLILQGEWDEPRVGQEFNFHPLLIYCEFGS